MSWRVLCSVLVGCATASLAESVQLEDDPVLNAITSEALERRPELGQGRALIDAANARALQASVFPDAFVGFGLQNDGFTRLQIGSMATSFWLISASQTFPWVGKRALRGEVMGADVEAEKASLQRTELTLRAQVQRTYIDLLLVRERLVLLKKLELLWKQSADLARVRYEAGDGAQSDLLRAQLEGARLIQRRLVLETLEFQAVAKLNRLRGHSPTDPLATSTPLSSLAEPRDANNSDEAMAARSPELSGLRVRGAQLKSQVDLAHREFFPDVTLNVALMPRGALEPMWSAGVGLNLPIFNILKQTQAVTEFEAQGRANQFAQRTLQTLLEQRTAERQAALKTLRAVTQLYRGGLLVQSEATVTATLAQYQVGRASFASVLEALVGYLGDSEGFLQAMASLQNLGIAQREISLESVGLDSVTRTETPAPGGM